MALDRKREVGPRHAGAVVGDADQAPAAAVGRDLDAGRAGVERVLDQLLDHARRALDHLARGDAVDQGLGELADGHGFCGLIRNGEFYRRNAAAARAGAEMPPLFERRPALPLALYDRTVLLAFQPPLLRGPVGLVARRGTGRTAAS